MRQNFLRSVVSIFKIPETINWAQKEVNIFHIDNSVILFFCSDLIYKTYYQNSSCNPTFGVRFEVYVIEKHVYGGCVAAAIKKKTKRKTINPL